MLLGLSLVECPHVVFLRFVSLQDQKLLREERGWELVAAAAQYWCSRMVWSEEERCYHITGTPAAARPAAGTVCEQRLPAPPARRGQEGAGSAGSCPPERLAAGGCVHVDTGQDAQLSSNTPVWLVFLLGPCHA